MKTLNVIKSIFTSKWFPFLSIFFFLGLILLRNTNFLFYPRLWAEEGRLFYEYALNNTFWDAVCYIPPMGYYSIVNNIAAILAAKVNIVYAPVITQLIAFIIQIIPILIIILGKSIFKLNLKKYILCFFIVFSAPVELWLTTTTSQFFFLLIATLILIEDTSLLNNLAIWWYRALLVISSFTGLLACFTTPAYIYKYIKNRDKESAIQMSIMIVCSVIQAILLLCYIHNQTFIKREIHFKKLEFYKIFFASIFRDALFSPVQIHYVNTILAFFVLVVLLFVFIINRKKYIYQLIFIVFSVTSILSHAFSIGGCRYYYVPAIMIIYILLSTIEVSSNFKNKILVYINIFIISISISLNSIFYFTRSDTYYPDNWPKWETEVNKLKFNKDSVLLIHPQYYLNAWDVDLKKHKK